MNKQRSIRKATRPGRIPLLRTHVQAPTPIDLNKHIPAEFQKSDAQMQSWRTIIPRYDLNDDQLQKTTFCAKRGWFRLVLPSDIAKPEFFKVISTACQKIAGSQSRSPFSKYFLRQSASVSLFQKTFR
jgi:hypothetical protein